MELKDKEAFFAQYWNQFVGIEYERGDGRHVICDSTIKTTDCVELKSLEDISDEDAIQVAKLYNPSNVFENPKKGFNPYVVEHYEDAREFHYVDYDTILFGDKKETVRCEINNPFYLSLYYFRTNDKGIKFTQSINRSDNAIKVENFLRANGYLIDWTNKEGYTYTTKELLEDGVVKLKSK